MQERSHAAYGHNAFFKSNYLFRQFTQADGILDYLTFARNFILDCEQRHGWREVERILDCCHALAPYGIDRYKKPTRLSASRERERLAERLRFAQFHYNPDVAYLYEGAEAKPDPAAGSFDPQENLLYFIEKSAPKLAPWQRELVRIVRKISQYFYPQRLTRVANEGAATFWHYTLLHELYDHGQVDDGFMQIRDNVFIVTGGASGLGGATSRTLAGQGGKIIIADVQADHGEALARELGAGARFVKCDVASEVDGRAAVEAALAFGPLRGLINCAGIAVGEKTVGKEGPHALASFARVININLVGTFNMNRM